MFIHTVKMFLKFLPFPPCVTFRQPLVLRTHKPSPSSSHGSRTFGPQVRSTTQMPFYLGHGTKHTVETDHELPHMEQTLKDTMAPAMARQRLPPTQQVPCSRLVTPMRKTQTTSSLEESYPTADLTFSCFQSVILTLFIYGVVVWGLRMKTKENEPLRTGLDSLSVTKHLYS